MTGTVILITVLTALLVNRRWLMFGVLLVGGFPIGIFAAQERFSVLYANGAYLLVILLAVMIALLYAIPTFLSQSLRFYGYSIFLLYCITSFLWTSDFEWGLRMLVKFAAPFVFLISMQAFLKNNKDLELAESSIIVSCLIASTLAVINTLGNGVIAADDNMYNIQHNYLAAPFMSPANFSFLIGSGAILALTNLFKTKKITFFFLFFLFSFFLFWSFVRISMFALITAVALIILMLSKNIIIKLMIPVVIIVVFVMCFFTMDKFRNRMFKSDKVTLETVLSSNAKNIDDLIYTSGRTALWREVYKEFIIQAPLLGHGIGSTDSWLDRKKKGRLHSEYLRIVCDTGLVGLVLYVFAILQFYLLLIVNYFRNNNELVRVYCVRALAGLTFYVITLMTDNSLNYISEFALYVFSYLAFAFISTRRLENISEPSCLFRIPIQSSQPIPNS